MTEPWKLPLRYEHFAFGSPNWLLYDADNIIVADIHGEARAAAFVALANARPPGSGADAPIPLRDYKRDDRPQKGGWAPGTYCCKCVTCGARFMGDKRAVSCADCAHAPPVDVSGLAKELREAIGHLRGSLRLAREGKIHLEGQSVKINLANVERILARIDRAGKEKTDD